MGPLKRRAGVKRSAPPEREQPEEQPGTAEGEEEEEEEEVGEYDDEGSSTGKPCTDREKYAFRPAEENILVEWFQERKEFYDRSDIKFYARRSKRQKLEALAKRLGCNVGKIEGWFRNQRTAVGKLKRCSNNGSVVQNRTPRQEWQLKSFTFLQDYITPRTYTTEPTEVGKASSSVVVHSESDSCNEECPQSPSTSSVAAGSSRQGKRAKNRHQEDVTRKYVESPRSSQDVCKQIHLPSMDTREAFGHYVTQYMRKIPDSRWDQFTMEALQLLSRYSRPETDQPQVQQSARDSWQRWGPSPAGAAAVDSSTGIAAASDTYSGVPSANCDSSLAATCAIVKVERWPV